jgi:hypothetical protein
MKNITKNSSILYTFLGLAITAPLFKPGYIFALDMVFGPRIELPTEVTSSYPFYLSLWLLNHVLPAQIIQKLLLLIIFFLSGFGAHRLSAYLIEKTKIKNKFIQYAPYYAGILYTINPFTYGRFMDGQFSVLFGYALLPFFTRSLFQLFLDKEPNRWQAVRLAGWAVLISIVSIHSLGPVAVLSISAALVALWKSRHEKRRLTNIFVHAAFSLLLFLAASSYWVVPMFNGSASRAELISNFDDRYILTFRTGGSTDIGAIGNMLSLYGYWGEREDRFEVPREHLVYWPILAGVIIALAGVGWWRHRRDRMVNILAIAALIGLVLAAGLTVQPFSFFNRLLYDHVPFYRGFREPHKFVGLIALAYSALGSLGFIHLAGRIKSWSSSWRQAALALLMILPIAYTPTLLWGGGGQLRATDYPADWYEIDQTIISKAKGRALFLPWHQYMRFDFADRVIANPAPIFFSGDVIAGDNAEIGLLERQIDSSEADVIEPLLSRRDIQDAGARLAPLGVQYVILSKTADWEDYGWLDQQSDLRVIWESETLVVFSNLSYRN